MKILYPNEVLDVTYGEIKLQLLNTTIENELENFLLGILNTKFYLEVYTIFEPLYILGDWGVGCEW